jgi:carboxypeptidase PM20D1
MAHMDVVPAETSTLSRWTHPPFSGHNDGTFIWGRGALDMKPGLIGIMEAVEYLAGQGFRPKRTVYIALGCDEEQGGEEGSMLIARLLESRGVRLDFVLDEGGSIVSGMIAFLSAPVALIGIAEKGYLTLELSVESQGGHSSMPPRETPAGVLCAAVARLEQSPFPARVDGVVGRMLDYLAPEAGLPVRFVLSNRWLFGPLLRTIMAKAPSSAASLRTTIAPTMLQGSERDNVIPSRPSALVNFRILPGETAESVTRYVIRAIGDPRVKVSPAGKSWNPSPVSSTESKEFRELQKTISQVFPGTVIAPYLVLGATDSRHYNAISDNIYRFMPYSLVQEDLDGIHGINERISVDNMKRSAEFYTRLIRNLN